MIHCGPGDVVAIKGPGAGGYGLAKNRSAQAVLQDVQRGFLSEQPAREQYGVMLQQGEIDEVGTAVLRSQIPESNGDHFDVGSARWFGVTFFVVDGRTVETGSLNFTYIV